MNNSTFHNLPALPRLLKASRRWLDLVPYIGLAIAISIGSWSFMRSEQYREETDIVHSQMYEIQWRMSQIREELANIIGYMTLSIATRAYEPRLVQEMGLLKFNIASLRNLEYIGLFFETQEIDRLGKNLMTIQTEINPVLDSSKSNEYILRLVYEIHRDVSSVFGASAARSRTWNETTRIEEDALRNTAIFAMALSALIVVGVIIRQRAVFAERRDQQTRSFSSLFGHMTRSRISGLALFLKNLGDAEAPDREMVAAARRAVGELDSINDGLLKIAYSGKQSGMEPLAVTMAAVELDHGGRVRLDLQDDAGKILVPAPQFHLISDELVRNARQAVAVAGITDPVITVRARVVRRFLFGRRLILEVTDNGIGMPPEVLEKATDPLFSTKAGAHVGLGLTSCAEMVKTMQGKLKIESTEGVGTTVRIVYPLS